MDVSNILMELSAERAEIEAKIHTLDKAERQFRWRRKPSPPEEPPSNPVRQPVNPNLPAKPRRGSRIAATPGIVSG